ncbi:MAG: hypothetical protein KU37_08750 [Sulfuricurvum sp. PC08-66]|nr:MAG: hypothetical protein KU37_08750 [Sulfuricurvum sp. PC08-66]
MKWDKRVRIDVGSITKLSPPSNSFELKVPNLYYILRILYNTTESIHIEHFKIDSIVGTLDYKDKNLIVNSSLFDLKAIYQITPKEVFSKELYLRFHDYDLEFIGSGTIESHADTIKLDTLFSYADVLNGGVTLTYLNNQVTLDAKCEPITDLGRLEAKLGIDPYINEWVFKRLQAKSLHLDTVRSVFAPNKLEEFLAHLYVDAHYEDVSYVFDKDLAPVVAQSTHLTIQNSVASFTLESPSYRGHAIDAITASIDKLAIKRPQLISYPPMLRIDIDYKGLLTQQLMDILRMYDVNLPLAQRSGTTKLLFKYHKNLISKVKGWYATLSLNSANFLFNRLPFHVQEANLRIHDKHIFFESLKFAKKDEYRLSLKGDYDITQQKGEITGIANYFNFYGITNTKPIPFVSHFSPQAFTLEANGTTLNAMELFDFSISPNIFVLDANNTLHTQPIKLYRKGVFDATIDGTLNIKTLENSLTIALQTLNVPLENNTSLKLIQPLKLHTNPQDIRHIHTTQNLHLAYNNHTLSLEKFYIRLMENLQAHIQTLTLDGNYTAQARLEYDYTQQHLEGHLYDAQGTLTYQDKTLLLLKKDPLDFNITFNHDDTLVRIAPWDLEYHYMHGLHRFILPKLAPLRLYAPVLATYPELESNTDIRTRNFVDFDFNATLQNTQIPGYINPNSDGSLGFYGSYSLPQNALFVRLNDDVDLIMDDNLALSLSGARIDLDALSSAKLPINSSSSDLSFKQIDIDAQMGEFFFNGGHAFLYDTLQAAYIQGELYATVMHKLGRAILFYTQESIELFGEKFGDEFIRRLLNFNGLSGGEYSIYLQGTPMQFKGGITLQNATARGFTTYNNILALINSVPALLTLKSPGFNDQGYTINNGEILFSRTQNRFTFETIKLYGKSTNVFGNGAIDLTKKEIDLTLRIMLLKDAGTILSNIPIAGHLLLGDDGSLSTTLTVSGSVDDPKVSVNLGKDLIMAPVNIIKRTVDLPVKLLQWLNGTSQKSE